MIRAFATSIQFVQKHPLEFALIKLIFETDKQEIKKVHNGLKAISHELQMTGTKRKGVDNFDYIKVESRK